MIIIDFNEDDQGLAVSVYRQVISDLINGSSLNETIRFIYLISQFIKTAVAGNT